MGIDSSRRLTKKRSTLRYGGGLLELPLEKSGSAPRLASGAGRARPEGCGGLPLGPRRFSFREGEGQSGVEPAGPVFAGVDAGRHAVEGPEGSMSRGGGRDLELGDAAAAHHPRVVDLGLEPEVVFGLLVGLAKEKGLVADHNLNFAGLAAGRGGPLADLGLDLALDDCAGNADRFPKEPGREGRGRREVEIFGRAFLDNFSFVEEEDAVSELSGFFSVMGDEEGGRPEALEDFACLLANGKAQVDVEVGEGLVHEHQLRSQGYGPGQGDALLLTPAEGVGKAVLREGETHPLQNLGRPAVALLGGYSFEAEDDILDDGEMGKEGVVLEDHRDRSLLGRHDLAAVGHALSRDVDASGLGRLQPAGEPEDGCLATAGGAEEADNLTRFNRK